MVEFILMITFPSWNYNELTNPLALTNYLFLTHSTILSYKGKYSNNFIW